MLVLNQLPLEGLVHQDLESDKRAQDLINVCGVSWQDHEVVLALLVWIGHFLGLCLFSSVFISLLVSFLFFGTFFGTSSGMRMHRGSDVFRLFYELVIGICACEAVHKQL